MSKKETTTIELDPLTAKMLDFCVEFKKKQQGLKQ